jgi:hypothetical protein
MDPTTVKLPIHEAIQSLYDEVDAFVVLDLSCYERIDLSMYEKVRKHVKSLFNPHDNPFGSGFTGALRLVDSDTALFLDADEIFQFKNINLRDIIKRYPLEQGAGISFLLRNYYCDRYHLTDGCSSKGPHIFRMRDDLFHDILKGHAVPINHVRRANYHPDCSDGVRVVNNEGLPMPQYQPVPEDEVIIHHSSHLDPISKMVRSIVQFNHTSTIDLPQFFPFDMRFRKEAIDMIYKFGLEEIENRTLELYKEPIPFDYDAEPFQLLEDFIKRANIREFNPEGFPMMEDSFTGCVQ